MPDFKKFNRSNGPRHSSFKGPRTPSREMYDAECNKCHARCQVPFAPNGKKPVYCANCFTREERPSDSSYGDRKKFTPRNTHSTYSLHSAPRPDASVQAMKAQLERMNDTLTQLLSAVQSLTNANALRQEVGKHVPASKAASTAAKPAKAAVKKSAAKVAKKAPAKAAAKPAKKAVKKAGKK